MGYGFCKVADPGGVPEESTLKRAFTLIELLVVIAIIAILAAILFPVFAQAKLAAKKTVSISNQKQLGLAILMYANDYDDTYPRNDGCTLNDSFVTSFNGQTAGTNPTPWCNGDGPANDGNGGYAFRDNHYEWGKWVLPYVKTTALFLHPVIQPLAGVAVKGNPSGLAAGEITGGYSLNLALTGAINAWPTIQNFGIRNSWLGGTTTSVQDPSEAMLIMEQVGSEVVGGYEYGTTSGNKDLTYYPLAVKEHWEGYFYQQQAHDTNHDCYSNGIIDNVTAPFNESVPLSYADGHTKALQVGAFLADTPTAAQYGLSYSHYICSLGAAFYGSGQPAWTQAWPLWGLEL
jgi:prepilin-type N-terminal cleavage/methylation domain-containing protein